jgi:anti-anti-sigma factor
MGEGRIVHESRYVKCVAVAHESYQELKVVGILSAADRELSRAVVGWLTRVHSRNILLNLSDVMLIDEAGLGMLLLINGMAEQEGCNLSLLIGGQSVRRRLAGTRVNTLIPTYDTLEPFFAALQPFAEGAGASASH